MKNIPILYEKRNEYMVDNSSKLVAVVVIIPAGLTTIRYAQKNLSVCIIPVKESIII